MSVRANIIGGERVLSETSAEVRNPYDGSLIAEVSLAGESQVDQAIRAAQHAYLENRRLPSHRLAAVARRVVEGIEARAEELARTIALEAGKPIRLARGEVERAVITFRLAAEEATRLVGELLPVDLEPRVEGFQAVVRRFPVGPVSGISPFNFPLNLVAHKVAPVLAVGSAMVLKPARQTPLSSLILAEIVEEAGAVPGTLSVVNCDREVGNLLVTDPRLDLLTFTGSPEVGWTMKQEAGRKKVVLELGGNAAAVIHEDCDLETAAAKCVAGSFAYAGQTCISVQRVLVHQPVYQQVREMIVEKTKSFPCGDPLDPEVLCGPLIDSQNADRLLDWIDRAVEGGARLLCGGQRQGNLVTPAVLEDVPHGMPLYCDEVFGPALVIEPYHLFDAALEQVNDSVFGLQAGVFTRDIRRVHQAFEELEVGGVVIGDVPTVRVDNYPYGGVKASGLGREGVRYAIEDMTERRVLLVNTRA
jgi:acyl-CoA reductase-like NAD-dependent aldehyde dehydrogenase